MVMIKLIITNHFLWFCKNALCATVIVAPDVNNKAVFNNGILYGSKGCKSYGGQTHPMT